MNDELYKIILTYSVDTELLYRVLREFVSEAESEAFERGVDAASRSW